MSESGLQNYRNWFPAIRARNPNARLWILEVGATALLQSEHHAVKPADWPDNQPWHGDDVGFRGGYGIPGFPGEVLAERLQQYVQDCAADGYVAGAFYFMCGDDDDVPDWWTHEGLDSPLEAIIGAPVAGAPSDGTLGQPGDILEEEGAMPERTERQQLCIDVVSGVAVELAGKRLPKRRRLDLGRQLADVADWLIEEFPKA